MTTGYFIHDDVKLFYTIHGPESGIPVLLVHGWCCDMTDWVFQLQLLQSFSTFRIICLDQRGHGRSPLNSKDLAVDIISMASDSAALLSHLGVTASNKGIVMGHSLGAVVVTEIVAKCPELVQAQVLVDPSYCESAAIFAQFNERMRANGFESEVAKFFEGAAGNNTPRWMKDWHKLRAWGMEKDTTIRMLESMVEHITPGGVEFIRKQRQEVSRLIPRLVVTSTQQYLGAVTDAGLDEELDRVQVIESGHWMMKANPDTFNTLLVEWLRQWGYLDGGSS